jgi:hypothetical protein
MITKLTFLSRQSGKRARSAGRRLSALLREYRRDPDTNFSVHSEAAALAVRASYYLRQAEAAGRIILTCSDLHFKLARPAFLPIRSQE